VTRSSAPWALLAVLAAVLVATALGVIVYWPDERTVERPANFDTRRTEAAEVVGLRTVPCRLSGRSGGQRVTVELRSGPDESTETTVSVGDPATDVALELGDEVRVFRNPVPEGAPASADRYSFADFERRRPVGCTNPVLMPRSRIRGSARPVDLGARGGLVPMRSRAGVVAAAGRAAAAWRSVWPMAVVMLEEDAEHPFEMAAIEDQEPVETLRSDRADEALGNRVRLWRSHWRTDDLDPFASEDDVEVTRELAVAIPDQKAHRRRTLRESPSELTGLLGDLGRRSDSPCSRRDALGGCRAR
jgi:hypothetical protein